ncbi:MAG: heavy-metal-associated domain-containing protein [Candidatus Latescibacteria bacterium]|nr:heavy-metal-associated domain-containing protein [Candidatus Latescibacterota bacterium]
MRKVNLMLSLWAVAAFLLGASLCASAQVEAAAVKLDGLSCPFCAYGLEKKLKKVEGVEEVKIEVDQGLAKLAVKKDKSLSLEEVEAAVKEGGFTPKEIALTVRGRLAERHGRIVLTLPGSEDILLVEANEQLQKLRETLAGADKAVRLTGKVVRKHEEGHAGHPYVFSVERFEAL